MDFYQKLSDEKRPLSIVRLIGHMSKTQILDSMCCTFFGVISLKGSALFAIKLVDITPIDL